MTTISALFILLFLYSERLDEHFIILVRLQQLVRRSRSLDRTVLHDEYDDYEHDGEQAGRERIARNQQPAQEIGNVHALEGLVAADGFGLLGQRALDETEAAHALGEVAELDAVVTVPKTPRRKVSLP